MYIPHTTTTIAPSHTLTLLTTPTGPSRPRCQSTCSAARGQRARQTGAELEGGRAGQGRERDASCVPCITRWWLSLCVFVGGEEEGGELCMCAHTLVCVGVHPQRRSGGERQAPQCCLLGVGAMSCGVVCCVWISENGRTPTRPVGSCAPQCVVLAHASVTYEAVRLTHGSSAGGSGGGIGSAYAIYFCPVVV